ncbi:hypothetical protein U4960_15060 [Altererythrobacter sp. H2]|uniref:hypothetical protein n=1 Tax=Altererythrobacter sp. H2 TaxID=3108391 RepID=UPI002B4BB206|nr:hypothetical protein [Altererythrobacter sp. H2]WRK95577.1 hypothetical protein U4960_15060 [Altererythrobacter sp. H2]
MIGKILGAFAGSQLAKNTSAIGGTGGALLGAGAATLARRASLPTLVALTAGGYFLKRHMEKRELRNGVNSTAR